MIPYWLLFLFPALTALAPFKATYQFRNAVFIFYFLLASLLVGFRYEIGGDWQNYLNHLDSTISVGLVEALVLHDPGYMAINWLSSQLGFGIAGVNLTCAVLFMTGLLSFCIRQPMPWVGISIAAPYLLTVVAMGYTRQSAALGIIFLALNQWKQGGFLRYSLLILIAALFHKSAVVMLPLALFMDRRNRVLKVLLGTPIFTIVALLLWADAFEAHWMNYVERQMHSEGGMIRVAMNGLAAFIYLILYEHFKRFEDFRLWWLISIVSLIVFAIEPIASTVVDRLALYLTPLQIATFSRLPLLTPNQALRALVVLMTLFFYGLVLWVWLNYATHREYWVPYRWILF